MTLPWIRGLVCGHGLLIERSELGNEQFQSPYAFPLSCKRSGSLYVWASGGLGIYQGRRIPPSLSFLVLLSFTLRFSFLFLPFSQNSSTVSIPSQAESSRATPTLPASLRRKSLVPAHRLKRLNPFFFLLLQILSIYRSLNNEVNNPTLARHTRSTRVLRTARGKAEIWDSGCRNDHRPRARSRVHRWT